MLLTFKKGFLIFNIILCALGCSRRPNSRRSNSCSLHGPGQNASDHRLGPHGHEELPQQGQERPDPLPREHHQELVRRVWKVAHGSAAWWRTGNQTMTYLLLTDDVSVIDWWRNDYSGMTLRFLNDGIAPTLFFFKCLVPSSEAPTC